MIKITKDLKGVSVVIPTHNRAKLIGRAIDSVLNQTYQNIEIIVVSDGSKDNTDEVMKEYCKKDSRIYYEAYCPAKGANVARNIGINKAKYEYVAFLDDDDEWVSDKLEKQLSLFESNSKYGMVCCGLHFIYVDEETESNYIPEPPIDSSKAILMKNCIGGTPSVIVKTEILRSCGGFDEKLHALQDYDLWIRICQKTQVGVLREASVNCFDQISSFKISNNTQKYINSIARIENKYSNLISKLTDDEKRTRNFNMNMLIAKKGLRNGQKTIARKYAIRAFKEIKRRDAMFCWLGSFVPYELMLKAKILLRKS